MKPDVISMGLADAFAMAVFATLVPRMVVAYCVFQLGLRLFRNAARAGLIPYMAVWVPVTLANASLVRASPWWNDINLIMLGFGILAIAMWRVPHRKAPRTF